MKARLGARGRAGAVAATVLALALVSIAAVDGCRMKAAEGAPSRPFNVPPAAFWLGGPDGGVFVLLKADESGGHTHPIQGTIFHQNGQTWFTGRFVAEPAGATIAVEDRAAFMGWDGERLLLTQGRALRAVRGREAAAANRS
jgi:hypothetical protein